MSFQRCERISITSGVIGLFLLVISSPILAAPSILGTFSGTESETESCTQTDSSGTFSFTSSDTDSISLTIAQQSGNSFSGSSHETDHTLNYSGTISDPGVVSGSFTESYTKLINGTTLTGTGSGTFSGTLSGDTLSISFSGTETASGGSVSETCSFSGTITATRAAAGTITPSTAPSTTVVTATEIRSQTTSLVTPVSARTKGALQAKSGYARHRQILQGFMLESNTGQAAGDKFALPFGVWASYSRSEFDNDFAATAYDGDRDNVLMGIDVSPFENTIVGVAFGYEDTEIDNDFNRGEMDADGFSVIPYFGVMLTGKLPIDLSADVNFGYSDLETEQFRLDPTTDAQISSDMDSHRWFWSGNLNAYKSLGNWLLGTQAGYLWTRDYQDDYTESDGTAIGERTIRLRQWNIGGDVAYTYDGFSFGIIEPFAKALYERDYTITEVVLSSGVQPANDRDDVLMTAGLRYFGPHGLSGIFEWTTRVDRENFDEDIFSFTLRMDF